MVEVPTRADLLAALERIGGGIRRTPVLELDGLPDVDATVVLKLELFQHTGSFKARGALNNVLSLAGSGSGVCAASGGNHAAGVAWAARRAGVAVDLFVPANATPAKIDRIREYGGRVHLVAGYVQDALEACSEFAGREALPQIHPYDTVETVAGAGTLGLEIAEQVPDAQLVVLACGGGGLYSGTSIALQHSAPVQPVEPEMCPALAEAIVAGRPVEVVVGGIASDSLGAAKIGDIGFAVASESGVRPVLVTEEQIIEARRLLWSQARVLAEPGACVALAGVMSGRVGISAGGPVVVVVTGGNNDTMP